MSSESEDVRLDEAVAAYLNAVDEGQAPSREEFLRGFPQMADDLVAALDAIDVVDAAANAMFAALPVAAAGSRDPWPTLGPAQPGRAAGVSVGDRVTYFGDYELVEEIARGGMGIVFRARQVSLNRPVALKMILDSSLASDEAVRRFRREAEAAASLDHENIVKIFEVGQHEGHCYFTMELLGSGSLSQDIASRVGDERGAAALMRDVARAVDHGHRRGILHRDLKPANILLDRNGSPHVCDFGLARRVEDDGDLTQTGAVLGTPSYMAPEQAAGRRGELTVASDVWSLGAILYELLTGKPPHTGSSPLEILREVLENDPERPRVSSDIGTIVMKCLHREPDQRYPTAAALADDLGRFLERRPILARPVRWSERARKWIRRHPARAGLIASLVIGIGAVLSLNLQLTQLLDKNRFYLYAADMKLARQEFGGNRVLQALELLAKYDPGLEQSMVSRVDPRFSHVVDEEAPVRGGEDLRGFEWYELWNRCHASVFTIDAHTGTVAALAMKPDGSEFVTAAADGWIIKWDTATSRRVVDRNTALSRRSTSTSMAFSPDGSRLVVAHSSGTVEILDANDLKPIGSIASPGHLVPACVSFAPNGKFFLIGGSPQLHDSKSFESVGSFTGSKRLNDELCAIAADSTLIATGGHSGSVRVWDTHGHRLLRVLREPKSGPVRRSDSRRSNWTTRNDALYQWSTYGESTGTTSITRTLSGDEIYALAFSPTSNMLAAGTIDGDLLVWNADTGEQLIDIPAHQARISKVAFAPDGNRIATASWDTTVALWDVATGRRSSVIRGHTEPVYDLAFSPDGTVLVTGSDDSTVRGWMLDETLTPRKLPDHEHYRLEIAAVSPDATKVVTTGVSLGSIKRHTLYATEAPRPEAGFVHVWAADNGKHLLALGPLSAKPKALAWSGDGTRIAVVATATDTKVRIFDSSDGTQLTQIEMPSGESWSGAALSHDGKMIAVASGARVLLHGLDPQRLFVELKLGGTGDARCVNFSPDGEYLIVAAGSMTSVWNWKSGKLVGKVNPKRWTKRTAKSSSYFNLEVRSLAVSPDSRLMAMGLVTGEIQIRTLPGLDEVAVLEPSGGWVEAMDFSADGRTLASGSWNRTVHLWDLASGLECAALEDLPHPAFALKFSADTSKLVALGRYGSLKTWDASR